MSDAPTREQAMQAILGWIAQDPEAGVYAIVDACQAWDLLVGLQANNGRPLRNLFKGTVAMSPGIQTVAPTFVPMQAHPEFLPAWVDYLGKHAGVLVRSHAKPMMLFKHLRKTFIVQDASGQEHFFRFYDPRVLRIFLRASSNAELAEFFGPIDACLIEGDTPECLETFDLENGKLRELQASLEPAVLQASAV